MRNAAREVGVSGGLWDVGEATTSMSGLRKEEPKVRGG